MQDCLFIHDDDIVLIGDWFSIDKVDALLKSKCTVKIFAGIGDSDKIQEFVGFQVVLPRAAKPPWNWNQTNVTVSYSLP
eukprot:10525311-Karenia_brevis.AAC.1